jgi:hypothetical protein|tara:strand:+ start:163 stop:324 length:162 start_codon:yes stop_codon:yes gene_type:complete
LHYQLQVCVIEPTGKFLLLLGDFIVALVLVALAQPTIHDITNIKANIKNNIFI